MYPSAVFRDYIPHLIVSFIFTIAHGIYLIGRVSFIPSDKPLAACSHLMKMQTRPADSVIIGSVNRLNRSLLEYFYICAVFFSTFPFFVGYHVFIFIAVLGDHTICYYPELSVLFRGLYDFIAGVVFVISVGILHTKP